MSENKKKRRVKVGWIFFVILYLVLDPVSRIIVSMDFINPKGFLIESVESQGKAYQEAQKKNENLFSLWVTHRRQLISTMNIIAFRNRGFDPNS
jgi:hypothetical protein